MNEIAAKRRRLELVGRNDEAKHYHIPDSFSIITSSTPVAIIYP
ncbi:hypothetical protein LOAG_15978 [Loa loa]|uniref:Uncharacterized protein n=1 Tax=Loa loa TaxID=7209 RepID=A0A1S0TFP1_LOALO|nr:hypothetical protein LOAG_15978 [Loa loa]EFO12555.1 hypothetical protein LOAG_15978 [Loa loa]